MPDLCVVASFSISYLMNALRLLAHSKKPIALEHSLRHCHVSGKGPWCESKLYSWETTEMLAAQTQG